eukprot:sb/3464392/
MDSPEEVPSPLLTSNSPEDEEGELQRPCTPELDLPDDIDPPSSPPMSPPPGVSADAGVTSEPVPSGSRSSREQNDFALPDNLSDNEDQATGQAQRSGLINDIFGDSDEEEEEESSKLPSTLDEDDLPGASTDSTAALTAEEAMGIIPEPGTTTSTAVKPEGEGGAKEDPDTDEELEMLNRNDGTGVFVSDFDAMMEKKKQERKRTMARKKKDEFITTADDRIMCMISKMKEAAEEDRRLNTAGQAAVNKLAMLKVVINQLKKQDLHSSFIECGILPVLADWLSPLPDNSLPHLSIRREVLSTLRSFKQISTDMLKESKLGTVVMGLYKNNKEQFSNREVARKLIYNWARPIFGLDSDYSAMSREEREKEDQIHMLKNRRKRKKVEEEQPEGEKPGDKNFILRARVPVPSNTDYVNRPRSKIDEDVVVKRHKQKDTKFDKLNQLMQNKKKMANPNSLRSSSVCITGNKMPL